MRSRPHVVAPEAGAEVEGEDFARVDWWGVELEGVTFTRCRFDDAGLEELVTRRCVFDQCVLTGVLLGGSRHSGSAFLSCRFDRAKLFDVVWDGCKLTGSQFPGAELRPMTSTDSDWSWTSLRGVDLSGPGPLGNALPGGRPDRRRPAGVRPDGRRPGPRAAAGHEAARCRPARCLDGGGELAGTGPHRRPARPRAVRAVHPRARRPDR